MAGGGEAAALDRREVLAHRVQLVDVRPLFHQETGAALLRLERNARGGQRHQRRAAARDQHEQEVALIGRTSHLERTTCPGHAAAVRKRMSSVIPDSRGRQRDRGVGTTTRTNREQRSQGNDGRRRTRLDHRRGSFTRGDDVNGRGTLHRLAHLAFFERMAYEQTGIDRINRRP